MANSFSNTDFDDATLGNILDDLPADGAGDDEFAAIVQSLQDGGGGDSPYPSLLLPAEPAEPAETDWSVLELYMERHSVHLVTGDADGKEYVVSNLKKFEVTLCLYNRQTREFDRAPLELKASLLYENSQAVRAAPDEEILSGDVLSKVQGGRAVVRLQLGKRVLSLHHDHQRFRVKIEPADPQLAAAYPNLTQLTEPLKSVTKLRGGPGEKAKAEAKRAAAAAAPLPNSAPCNGRAASTSGAGGGPPSLIMPPMPLPGGGASASSACAAAAAQRAPASAASAEARLQATQSALGQERGERASLEEIVRQQKAQIEQLTMQNGWIMEELGRMRTDRQGEP